MSASDLLASVRTGEWLNKQTFPPLQYALQDIIPAGFTLMIGAPKIGKSFLAYSIALAKAAGGHALGSIKVDQGPVLLLALEDGDRRMQTRARMLLGDEPIPAAFEYMTRVEPENIIPTITEWMARHRGECPLVILDTLGKVMPPAGSGESAYQRDYRIGSSLKQLADSDPGAALIVNHHDRKAASDDFVDSVSGTHGLAGAADTTIVLSRDRGSSNGLLRVTGRDVIEGQYAVGFEAGVWQLEGGDLKSSSNLAHTRVVSSGLGGRSGDILAFVSARPGGSRAADVASAIGIDGKAAADCLVRLSRSGHIKKESRGLYLPWSQVSKVSKVCNDETTDSMVSTLSTGVPLEEERGTS